MILVQVGSSLYLKISMPLYLKVGPYIIIMCVFKKMKKKISSATMRWPELMSNSATWVQDWEEALKIPMGSNL